MIVGRVDWKYSEQARSVQLSFAKPCWSPGSVLTWGAWQWLGFQKSLLSSSDAQFPVSLPPAANLGSAQPLVFQRLSGITPGWYNSMYCHFLACSGHCPGTEESLCEMLCEPESARVAVPKCTCSGPCFYSQSWRVSDGRQCLGSVPWLELIQSLLEAVMQYLSEMGRVGPCIFPSPAGEILPGIRKGNVKYPAQSAAA